MPASDAAVDPDDAMRELWALVAPTDRRHAICGILAIVDCISDPLRRYEDYRRVAHVMSVPVEILWSRER